MTHKKKEHVDKTREDDKVPTKNIASMPQLVSELESCTECSYITMIDDNLINHMRTYTQDDPHKCLESGKEFVDENNLAEHKRQSHIDNLKYCGNCHFSTTMDESLLNHMKYCQSKKLL